MPRSRSPRVNLASIAERLGVSVSTVSRALRNQSGIHPETEARVRALSREMGYLIRSPETPQQGGSLPELRHVLALSQSSSPVADQRFLAGMSGAAVEANVALLSHLVAERDCATVLDPRLGPASLRAGLVQGVLLLHKWPGEIVAKLSAGMPTVSIVHDYPESETDLIGTDDRRGMDEVVGHLVAGGCRRIGFFGLCPEVSWCRSRFGAFAEALVRHGMSFSHEDVVVITLDQALSIEEFSTAGWEQRVSARSRSGVDAWICPSAITGRTLCRFLLRSGRKLPADVALASYHGGSIPESTDLPRITTTDVADEELGAAAMRRLLIRISHPRESRRSILVPARLRAGDTTRTPRQGAR